MTKGCAPLLANVHNTLVSVWGRGDLPTCPAPAKNRVFVFSPGLRTCGSATLLNSRDTSEYSLRIRPRKLAGLGGLVVRDWQRAIGRSMRILRLDRPRACERCSSL
jgi:hypothetical protein